MPLKKIAIVGCGAVGSFYGAKLARAGSEVHFLLRSDYEAVRRDGVSIRTPEGDFNVCPRSARSPQEIGPSDLVVIALKTTANHRFPDLLSPLAGPNTLFLTLQNGLGNEEQMAQVVPAEQILGGLCFVCLNRIAPGVVRHMDHGQIVLGEFKGPPRPRTHEVAALFQKSRVPCRVTDHLARAHWEKLVWNIPFNGLGVASAAGFDAVCRGQVESAGGLGECLTTDKLLGDPRWERLTRELMLEVIGAARRLGFDIPEAWATEQLERTRTMGAYKASTLIDFERKQALELDSLFLEPLRQAEKAGASVPRLSAMCSVLRQLDPARAN